MAAEFRLFGVEQMQARLRTLATQFPHEVGRAMRIETEIEATEARRRTPVKTGVLRASIHVTGPDHRGRLISTHIVAGGPAAPYAVAVHENLYAFHATGRSKFVESVLLESVPFLSARIAKRVDLNKAVGL